jgi:hypothetical protein
VPLTIQHLREACEVLHLAHAHASALYRLGAAPRRHQLVARRGQALSRQWRCSACAFAGTGGVAQLGRLVDAACWGRGAAVAGMGTEDNNKHDATRLCPRTPSHLCQLLQAGLVRHRHQCAALGGSACGGHAARAPCAEQLPPARCRPLEQRAPVCSTNSNGREVRTCVCIARCCCLHCRCRQPHCAGTPTLGLPLLPRCHPSLTAVAAMPAKRVHPARVCC